MNEAKESGLEGVNGDAWAEVASNEANDDSGTLFRTVFEHAPDAIVLVNGEGRISLSNRQIERYFGYSPQELLGRPMELLLPELSKVWRAEHHPAADPASPFPPLDRVSQLPARRKDGSEFSVDMTLSPVKTRKGQFFLCIIRSQGGMETTALRRRARQQRAVAQLGKHAPGLGLVSLMDAATALLARTLGVEYSEILELLPQGDALLLRSGVGWKPGVVGHATVSANDCSQAAYTLRANKVVIVDSRLADDSVKGCALLEEHGIVNGMTVLIHGQDRPFGMLGVHTKGPRTFAREDGHFLQAVANVLAAAIEHKRAEETLRERQARIHAILDGAVDGIITIDERGIIESVNTAAENLFGYARQELIGKGIEVLMPEPYRSEHNTYLANYLRTGQKKIIGIGREVVGRRKDGTTFPLGLAVSEVRLTDRRLFTGIVRDLSEAKKVERMRKELYSIASHELRTPLTNIALSLDLIARSAGNELPARIKTMLDIARRSSERLTRLVNDILDIQKFEAGEMTLRVMPLELTALVEEAVRASQAYAEQSGARYVLQPAAPSITVKADSDRLMQVLINLLSNAAKFSPPDGTVEVSVSRYHGSVRVAVTDHGPGIQEDFRDYVFQPFAQAKPSLEDRRHYLDSAGLGLSIAKTIVEKLGGRIGFETEPNVATTFYFDLPEWQGEGSVANNVQAPE